MSSPEETSALKAGHPPAVKVGGMRISQHKPSDKSSETKKEEAKEKEVAEETTSASKQVHLISGAVSRGDADFPPEAIKAFHESPTPTHQFRKGNPKNTTNMVIHQPRK